MRLRSFSSFLIRLLAPLVLLPLSACGTRDNPPTQTQSSAPNARFPDPREKDKPQVDLLKDEIPPKQLDDTVRAHLEGLGHMERYEYHKAVNAFREVRERAPGWIAGSINLAIALLNDSGVEEEKTRSRKGAGAVSASKFDEPLSLLDEVLRRDPDNLSARFNRGLILEFLGRTADAHREFLFVTAHDPSDAHAWFKVASTLTRPDDPGRPAGPSQAQELLALYQKALDRNPYLVTALYKLQQVYGWAREPKKQAEMLARWRRLNPKQNAAGSGEVDMMQTFYGGEGKYALVVNPFPVSKAPMDPVSPTRFDTPLTIQVKLSEGERWVTPDDFQGDDAIIGRVRGRFGATSASFDADGDGRADLFLAAAVKGPKGVRDALLLNRGEGRFDDVTHAWGLGEHQPSLGAAAADFDADRRIDLFLCGPGGYRLLRNRAGGRFEDVTEKAGLGGSKALGLTARWLDLDQDGDLDLYVVNHTSLDNLGAAFKTADYPGASNAAFFNVGTPPPVKGRPEDNYAPLAVATADLPVKDGLSIAFTAKSPDDPLVGPPARNTAVAALDLDGDHDLDLVRLADGAAPHAVLNDRLGEYHTSTWKGVLPDEPERETRNGLLVADFDKDGRDDLAIVGPGGRVLALRNLGLKQGSGDLPAWERWPTNVDAWRAAAAADLDLDTWTDLVGLPSASDVPALDWARNDGQRLTRGPLAVGPTPDGFKGPAGFALADFLGDALPDKLLIADGSPPVLARNLGNGRHWLALDLGGRWKTSFDHMRTNPHGLGTRVTVQGQGMLVSYDHTTQVAGLGQSVGPFVVGLDKSPSASLVRLRWPDGVMQCELDMKADTLLALTELNRKTGSCPVLFTWNGAKYVCNGDFLGGGGLGYLVAPGVYSQPDRDESVAISGNQLKPVQGVFRLSVTEPMDEVAYLDQLTLDVIDRPPGVSIAPDERFVPDGPRPTGEVIAWSTVVRPVKATDLDGKDVTETLRAWDRVTADHFRRLDGWVGYAEEHGIVLDFGDRLSKFGPKDPLVLALAGWVEYPYSQTNYAAATAGVTLRPPSVERWNDDGTWSVIEPHAGYPAGLPRLTTLDLTGKLNGPRCLLRLRTNMECYWDQAFVLLRDPKAKASLKTTRLAVTHAKLGHRGYMREVSPDGRFPWLYDYDQIDPAPLALFSGTLTRHGDVTSLLTEDDDRFCLVGPGDEVRLEFDGKTVPQLPERWARSYVLKTIGYCKDADPFTARSHSVEPLPWRQMPAFPFSTESERRRPVDQPDRASLDLDRTRPAGAH